uniref:G-protein coupled receptors family 1 profile domain-containing protein n=2 Tax=Meloidogyne TaxID=189290 RepID=A0A915PHU3_9BILA
MDGSQQKLLISQLLISLPFSSTNISSMSLINQQQIQQNHQIMVMPPADSIDESELWSVHSMSELVEMLYQMCFFAVGAPLNAISLKNFYKKRTKAHSGEMRLIRLSRQLLIAHLMVLCIYCLWRTYWIWNIHWTLGNTMCKAYSFLSTLPFHLWSNMVAAIAIDMLFCIRMPLGSVTNGNKRVTWLIAIAWILAIACAAPMTIFRGTRTIPRTKPVLMQCYHLHGFTNEQIMGFHFFHVITTFYLPLGVILFCYVSIGLSLRSQGASLLRQGISLANTDQHRRMQQNTKLRFLKASAAIVCAFVLSWLPYQVMALLRVVCEADSKCEKMASNFNWLQSILLASTCINPFLYRFGIFRSSGGTNGIKTEKRKMAGFLLTPGNGTCFGESGAIIPAIALPSSTIYRSGSNGSARIYEPNSSFHSIRSTTTSIGARKSTSANSRDLHSADCLTNQKNINLFIFENQNINNNLISQSKHYKLNENRKNGMIYQRLDNGYLTENKINLQQQLHPLIKRYPSPL